MRRIASLARLAALVVPVLASVSCTSYYSIYTIDGDNYTATRKFTPLIDTREDFLAFLQTEIAKVVETDITPLDSPVADIATFIVPSSKAFREIIAAEGEDKNCFVYGFCFADLYEYLYMAYALSVQRRNIFSTVDVVRIDDPGEVEAKANAVDRYYIWIDKRGRTYPTFRVRKPGSKEWIDVAVPEGGISEGVASIEQVIP